MPLTISYFHYLFGDDTALNHVRQFSRATRELGHRVEVSALNLANPDPGPAHPSNSETADGSGSGSFEKRRSAPHRLLSRYLHEPKELLWNLRYAKLERRILREQRPDVLVVRDNLWSVSYLRTAKALGIPVVLEVNAPASELELYYDQYLHLPAVIPNQLERYRLRRADRVSAVSTPLRDHLLSRIATGAKTEADRFCVIPNGVDPGQFDPSAAPDSTLPTGFDNHPVIGFVGSFQAFHGPELLATMTLEVARRSATAKFLFVGDGPGLDHVRSRVQGLGDRVHFTGSVEHRRVPALTRRIDIGVLPDTAFYCSPLKVLEWMASEVAIVAPDYPCLGDLLERDHEALVFAQRDPDALVAAVLGLLENPERRRSLGAAARARAIGQLTWHHNAQKMVALCQEAIAAAGSSKGSS
jgi:glycosyltransferase involved in cell wall biosynthesis